MKNRILSLSLLLLVVTSFVLAADVTHPANLPAYYADIDGKSGQSLFSALTTVTLKGFKTLGYDGALTAYKKTDLYPADSVGKEGLLWDMYGACGFDPDGNKECGNYKKECDCYNREHSIPKSWWGRTKNETYSDIFHLVPTDGYVNNRRSAYAFGEVDGNGTYSYMGAKLGSPKTLVVENTMNGNLSKKCPSSPVFEPIDQYKGDFARGYMGILVHYTALDMSKSDGASIFSGPSGTSSNYGLTDYGIALLLKWHRMDPVSQKEIDRNNGIQATQGNRNPFIDYPCLAEYLWGSKAGQKVNLSELMPSFSTAWIPSDGCTCGTNPAILMPTGTVDVGDTQLGVAIAKTVTVQGINLTGGISFSLSGTNASVFSLSKTTMTQAEALAGTALTITYNPSAEGLHEAVLTISGGGLSAVKEIKLIAECCDSYVITMLRNGVVTKVTTCGDYLLPTAEEEAAICEGAWKFKGWYSDDLGTFVEGQTEKPKFVLGVTKAETVYAVYGKSEGGGAAGAAMGTTLWKEEFIGFVADDAPEAPGKNATVYEDAKVTYDCQDGGSSTKIYNEKLAGGVAPELLIAKSNGTFVISGIPTGGATEITFSFKTNKSADAFSIVSNTTGVTVGTLTVASNNAACTVSISGEKETFDLAITNVSKSNIRADNFVMTVKTAGTTGVITYKKQPCEGGGESPSEVETTEFKLPTSKVVENGVLYILHDGKKYSTQGALVE